MALAVARCTVLRWALKAIVRNISGQVSIFFATTVVVLITFIAFIINVGLFVKAKINLQNAVDAAAWAGASVQARQLTNIAYLNWEMRNVYKEWMFKYYILGNLSLDVIHNGPAGAVDYTMETVTANQAESGVDSYNFPSVCITFASTSTDSTNICRLYSVPGLPVFKAQNLVHVDQVTTALVNTLSSSKLEACARRTALNFLTANLWAYNIKDSGGLSSMAPEIAPNRQGAFPAAFELALRIRSLEKFVNTNPRSNGICTDNGQAAGSCNIQIDTMQSQNYPGNERAVKAFHTAFRNLGGNGDEELKGSFTLTELPPQEVVFQPAQNLSNLLIPSNQQIKYYLDLKLMTLNYATFFSSFTSDTNTTLTTTSGTQVDTTGRCDVSKIALPVPGYPLGFVKNPSVLTYYAVKGEANWVGLFNPFEMGPKGIKITAYAAAKPFGGRIGPLLFDVFSNETLVKPRASTVKNVSSAYLIGLDFSRIFDWRSGNTLDTTGAAFVSGAPLPLAQDFWVTSPGVAVGGYTQDDELVFALPNLAYDYPNNALGSDKSYFSSQNIDVLKTDDPTNITSLTSGLFNTQILRKFRENLFGFGSGVGPEAVANAIHRARAPTEYDVNNYLIPSPESNNIEQLVDSFGSTAGSEPSLSGGPPLFKMQFFAPLFSEHSLYQTPAQAEDVFNQFLDIQIKAVEKFRNAMNSAALQISRLSNPLQGDRIGEDAARGFSDFDYNAISDPKQGRPSCASLLGKYIHFYLGSRASGVMGDRSNCQDEDGNPIRSLGESLRNYWTSSQTDLGEIYGSAYTISDELKTKVFSAYRPGPFHDASPNGVFRRTIGSNLTEKMWRNFYSTKFVSVNSLKVTGRYNPQNSGFPITSEGNESHGQLGDLTVNYNFLNPLNIDTLGIDTNQIFH